MDFRLLYMAMLPLSVCACSQNRIVEGVVESRLGDEIILRTDDTLYILDLTDADTSCRILPGSPVKVKYEPCASLNRALTVMVNETYAMAVGKWYRPSAVQDAPLEGFELFTDGTAVSINMPNLQFVSWKLSDNKNMIVLRSDEFTPEATSRNVDNAIFKKRGGRTIIVVNGVEYVKSEGEGLL